MKERIANYFFPHDKREEHFKALDGLRGVAVLFVLLSHSSNMNLMFHPFLNFEEIGKVGVYLFFVLSAYLLDRQIAIAFISNRSSTLYWKNYFLRRFLRIYPLFIIALFIHGLLTNLGFHTVIDRLSDIPLHMALLKGESIFWSIPVEFKYYFMSPVIMWVCDKYLKWNSTKVLILILAMVLFSVLIELKFNLAVVSTLRYFPIFLTGTFISIYELLKKDAIVNKPYSRSFNFIGLVSLSLIILTVPYFFKTLFGVAINFQHPIYFLPYAILWGLVLISAKYGHGIIKYLLQIKILRFIGTVSFSLYLFHIPVLKLIKTATGITEGLKIYLFFIISIIIATISYLLIERPLSMVKIYHKKLDDKEINKGKRKLAVAANT